jgi:hypothetical protein
MRTKSPLSKRRDGTLIQNNVTNAPEELDSLNAAIWSNAQSKEAAAGELSSPSLNRVVWPLRGKGRCLL